MPSETIGAVLTIRVMTESDDAATQPYNLNESLIWQLTVAGRLIRSLIDSELRDAGPQAVAVLVRLAQEDGLTQADLARRQRVEAPSMSGMVDRLVRAGHVTREPHPDDRRSVRIFITESGRQIVADSRAAVTAVHDEVFADLTDEDRSVLSELLTKVLARIPGP